MRTFSIFFLGFTLLAVSALAEEAPPIWMKEGPNLTNRLASFEIPIKVVATKLYVEVEVGGKPRRFVVDTGSPSMIDTKLSKELGLKVVGNNRGIDAHGVVIESEIVQASFRIGDVDFQKVPMITADFSAFEITKSFIGDGVLGSELFPLGVWQFDLQNAVLRFNTDLKKLSHVSNAMKLKLYQYGYPYMPIFDVKFAKRAHSKAMFDTGSPTFFAISSADLAGTRKADGIGRTISGYGSPGGSLGGQAPDAEQLQVELKTLSIRNLKLGRVSAVRRELSPSLIGARLLEHFVVTLDSRSGDAYFKKYFNGPFARPSFGFTLGFNNSISIAVVWKKSPAEATGLRPGMELTSINGVEIEFTSEGIRRAIAAMAGQEIDLAWKDGSAKLTRKTHILLE